MALTFPLGIDTFFGGLGVSSATFWLPESLEMSRSGSGEILTADLGARLWSGSISLRPLRHDFASGIEAKLSALRQAGRSFFVHDRRHCSPAADHGGVILGAATPVVASVAANNRDLTISGLPAGYVLSDGDHLSFTYGGSPLRYALHQIVVGDTADGAGEITVEVTPHIRPGVSAGAAVTLVRPFCKALIVPGSTSPASASGHISTGITFDFIQTLR